MDLKDFENISSKIDALFSVLPIISKLIGAVQFIAPNAAGVAKANFVIKTIISLQPELLGTEKIIPMFGMIWGVQGRISKMEGELKALYSIVEIIVKRKED